MKFWITFGLGLVLGSLAGVFVAAFVLLDDVGKKPVSVAALPLKAAVVKASSTPAKVDVKPEVNMEMADSMNKPTGVISAEAVRLEDLPSDTAETVLSTAKRDAAPDAPSTSVQ